MENPSPSEGLFGNMKPFKTCVVFILSFCAIILAPLVANAAFLFNTIPKENYTTITVQSLPAALSVEDSKVIQDE